MITLHKATYCENCPEFEAVTDKLLADGQAVQTKVYCKNIERCRSIYRHIKAQEGKEETAEREKWACKICPNCRSYVALKESPNKEFTCAACGHKWREHK